MLCRSRVNHQLRHRTAFLKQCFATSTQSQNADIDIKYEHGFALFSVPLPSRRERCQFTLLPATQTLADLISFLEQEDKGTDYVAVYSLDGDRIAKSTPIDVLLRHDFKIVVNDQQYMARIPPGTGSKLGNVDEDISRLKNSIAQLYSVMNIEQHQLEHERILTDKLESLRVELEPYEKAKNEVAEKSKKWTNNLTYLGLGAMGLQFGLLARLTWWEYSWDIMEPVTYFVGYGSAIAMFAYYILTKQEYVFPDVVDREFLLSVNRHATKRNLDISRYNELRDLIAEAEYDLRRLRDPLQLHLPIEYLQKLPAENLKI